MIVFRLLGEAFGECCFNRRLSVSGTVMKVDCMSETGLRPEDNHLRRRSLELEEFEARGWRDYGEESPQ